MRLLDQVAQCHSPVRVEQENGRRLELSGAEAFTNELAACPKRYVLDEQASAFTRAFFRANLGLFSPQDRFARLSAPSLWLEWLEPPTPGSGADKPVRAGVLCRGDESGRRGRIRSFWTEHGQVSAAPGDIVFDLDGAPSWTGARQVALDHSTLEEIRPLLRHACFEIDADWFAYYAQSRSPARLLAQCAEICWIDFPFALAFTLLLSMRRGPLIQSACGQARLNRARSRRGKPELLEHMEVRLALDGGLQSHGLGGAASRAAARLHQVRGHPVRRGEHVFWRRAHLRGAGNMLRQTTSVTAGRELTTIGRSRSRS